MIINPYILKFRQWFETLSIRERVLILGLAWAVIYALFYFSLFRSLEIEQEALNAEVKELKNRIANWDSQIISLNKIIASPVYKQWLGQHQFSDQLKGKYKMLLQTSNNQWNNVIKTILNSQANVRLSEIQNSAETTYNGDNAVNSPANLYQQKMSVVVYSSYFDTVGYLQKLEETLPNIHWDSITYEVQEYPIGKVEMEFSIFYEKAK